MGNASAEKKFSFDETVDSVIEWSSILHKVATVIRKVRRKEKFKIVPVDEKGADDGAIGD